MSDLAIRPAHEDDLPLIVALLADDMLGAAREDLGPPLPAGYHAAFAAIRADANQLLLVAEEEGEVVGTMQLTFLPGLSHKGAWRGQLEAVRVASARRGQGLGRQMVLWGIEECRRRGCAQMQLTSHNDRAEAHRFYRGLGFAQSHSGFKLKL